MTRYPRPDPSECPPYTRGYLEQVPNGDVLQILERQLHEGTAMLEGLPPEKADYAYAPGKWTVKEVLGHVTDAERVFAYRALRIARGDETPLPGFDENAWVPEGRFGRRTLVDLLAEHHDVRRATLALFHHLPPDADTRTGTASGHRVSVRALAYIITGHERHHHGVLRERYLS